MRIRKHSRITNGLVQAHVCLLNQSPWDTMTDFSPPPSPPLPPPPPMVHENSSSSVVNDESSVSEVKGNDREEEYNYVPDFDRESDFTNNDGKSGFTNNGDVVGEEEEENKNEDALMLCCKTDGKNWQCSRKAVPGNSMCEHHLSLANNRKTDMADGGKRRPGMKKAASSSSNPYEFYYYSGFGPRWGKKRGDDENDVDNVVCKSTLSQFIDEDLEDEDEELCERKRARKPIKARSLKSFM